MRLTLALIVSIAALATPALAANYYIVQNSLDKACSIAERAPDGKKQSKVGERTFDSKVDALKGLTVAPECRP
jgi:hypothetical protein